ncbi:MAG: hypothetical protein L3K23_08600 [Thermoplasmata archaeon]|nr:hypothetical protein [Thermoplasmata archaeon]
MDLFLQIRTSGERERAEEAVNKVRTQVWERFGNPVSPFIFTRAQVARPRNPALLKAIELEGLDVTGRA